MYHGFAPGAMENFAVKTGEIRQRNSMKAVSSQKNGTKYKRLFGTTKFLESFRIFLYKTDSICYNISHGKRSKSGIPRCTAANVSTSIPEVGKVWKIRTRAGKIRAAILRRVCRAHAVPAGMHTLYIWDKTRLFQK